MHYTDSFWNCIFNFRLHLTYNFLIRFNHIITPVMGNVVPNKHTMNPKILVGNP
ncbi:MAG: hypothetical protein RIQ50_1670, partial [Bacteroidota bacterium]